MNQKQSIFILFTIAIAAVVVISASYAGTSKKGEKEDKIEVVATFYPLGYFAEDIGGEHVSVNVLIPENTDVHAWQPAPSDILTTDKADIILYNGAGLDHWFEDDILPSLDQNNSVVVDTTDGIDLLALEKDHDEDENGLEYDPHTWISPYIAMQQAENIYDSLVNTDPGNETDYTANWNVLKTKFEALDQNFTDGLSNKTKGDIFTTHAAFGYLAHRYDFEQHSVIGLSADEEPSATVIADIADMMEENKTYVIYVDPVYPDEYAQTLKSEIEGATGESTSILNMYLMLGEMDGMDYFEQQEKNLENLKIGMGA